MATEAVRKMLEAGLTENKGQKELGNLSHAERAGATSIVRWSTLCGEKHADSARCGARAEGTSGWSGKEPLRFGFSPRSFFNNSRLERTHRS